MAALKDVKTVAAPWSNETKVVRVDWDFAKDGGATGAKDVLIASEALIIKRCYTLVRTTCTSGGSATLDLGVKSGDVDALLNTVAVASLAADTMFVEDLVEGTPNVLTAPLRLAASGTIEMTIGTAAMTAGKVEFVFEVAKA
jgi:hypothetical protein